MIVLAATFFYRSRFILCVAAALASFASCTIVKEYPGQPFVYETKVEIESEEMDLDHKKDLESQLENQVHDSIRVRTVQKIIGWEKGYGPRLFYSVMQKPPVYDSLHADKSATFMQGLLHSLGYYRDSIYFSTTTKEVDDQQRVTVQFNVVPGRQFKLDSIAYNFNDTLGIVSAATKDTLQKITDASLPQSFIKKGGAFAIPLIASERDRLSDVFRNNGYLLFSSEEILAVWDTVGLALLNPTLDPIEQLELLRQRRENPTADIELRLRTNPDTSHLRRFHVGNITIYPDLTVDSSLYTKKVTTSGQFTVVTYKNLFKPKIVAENIYLQPGELYRQRNYLRTLNRFNSIGSWRLVTIDQLPREGQDTVDFVVKLTPAEKYIFDQSLEGSQNWGNPLTEGTLIGVNFSLLNRNFARRAYQSTTNLRFGTEVASGSVANTTQASFAHSILIPRAIPKLRFLRNKENIRSSFGFSANYIKRVKFLELTTVNMSWGYEFTRNNKLYTVRFPNIEYAVLKPGPFLDALIASNQSYKYLFNDGLVSSLMLGTIMPLPGSVRVSQALRANFEFSGIPGLLRKFNFGDELYSFVKGEADYTYKRDYGKNTFAGRFLLGMGLGLPSSSEDTINENLPFFKGFFAGGASSMRSWPVRKLGPGSVARPFDRDQYPDRFGDMQLELNLEYRKYITTIQGVPINTVGFTDIGNIWYLRDAPAYDGTMEVFKFDSLFHDIAIGIGTGIRVDFGLFLIRLDYGYKVKDPSPADPALRNKLFPEWKPFGGQLQLGVTYPF